MPRRNTRAYYHATLLAHVKRVFTDLPHLASADSGSAKLAGAPQRLAHLRSVLPEEAILRIIDNTRVGEPLWRFELDTSAVSTADLASAAARIKPALRGRPLGHRRPIENPKLMAHIHAAVEAGAGSIRAICELFAKRHNTSAEGLRKQYRRYCKAVQRPHLGTHQKP